MQSLPKPISRLIESFERLPGIGPKTAARLTFYLTHVPQEELDKFADSVGNLRKLTVQCEICQNIGETTPCGICTDSERDQSTVCVVEQPLDVLAFERTDNFHGIYHVLHGSISPLNNIGPDDIYIAQLIQRLKQGTIQEIVLATNPTVEGEATAMYIKEMVKTNNLPVKMTRLAHGLPMGADVEYADGVTLSRALSGRREF